MRYALVQERSTALVVKVAETVDGLLELPFEFDPRSCLPRVYAVEPRDCRSGATLVRAIRRLTLKGAFKVLRV